jgi:hypothetical protein
VVDRRRAREWLPYPGTAQCSCRKGRGGPGTEYAEPELSLLIPLLGTMNKSIGSDIGRPAPSLDEAITGVHRLLNDRATGGRIDRPHRGAFIRWGSSRPAYGGPRRLNQGEQLNRTGLLGGSIPLKGRWSHANREDCREAVHAALHTG